MSNNQVKCVKVPIVVFVPETDLLSTFFLFSFNPDYAALVNAIV